MTAGVYTATLRGYTFGCDQEWEWTTIPTLGPGTYRTDRTVRVGRHGGVPIGRDYAGPHLVPFDLEHTSGGAAEAEAAAMRLRAAFAPWDSDDMAELTIELWSGTYMLRGRPAWVETRPESGQFGGWVARAEFEACDPLIYAADPKVAQVTFSASGGGMDTPMDTPMVTTGSGFTGDVAVTNDGTAPAPWTATIVPTTVLSRPRLILAGKMVELDKDFAPGAAVYLDSSRGSVTLEGAVRPYVSTDSSWWEIPPGQSTLSARASSGTGEVTVTWRDASY